MTIVEESYYDHDEYGRVRPVSVEDGEVLFEVLESEVHIDEIGTVPLGGREDADEFEAHVEPADVTIGVSSESLVNDEPNINL